MFYTLRRQISYNIPSEVSFPLNSSFRCPRKKILIMSVYFIFASSLPLPAGTVLGSTDVLMLLVCGGNSLLSQLPRSPLRPPPPPPGCGFRVLEILAPLVMAGWSWRRHNHLVSFPFSPLSVRNFVHQ